ncbi:MAG: hypothetical protein SFY69_06190 [Planctomycetota bacterium]|nr:hypothetical protein [Planctomycetota bacterium]
MSTHTIVGFATGLLLLSSAAWSQLVTPPPAKAPTLEGRIPVVVAPPAPPPPPPTEVRSNPQPVRARATPKRPPLRDLPDLKFTSLVQRDASGQLVLITHEPLEKAALRVNPTLPEGFVDSLGDYFAERTAAFERIAINNLDIIEKVEQNFIENTNYNEKEAITLVVNTLKPLTPPSAPKKITDDLEEKGKLEPTQAAFNIKVVREYQQARYPERKEGATDADKRANAWVIAKQASRYGVEESEIAYRGLIAEAAGKLPMLMDKIEMSEEHRDAARRAARGYKDSLSQDQKIKIWHDATSALSIDQRRQILRAMVDARESK